MDYLPAADRYNTMPYRRTGRSGLKLPAVSLGLWHNFGGVDTEENAREMLRGAFDLVGLQHFESIDTVVSEELLAQFGNLRVVRVYAHPAQ